MYLTDLKKDFFDKVITSRVLLLVNSDVDGVCATKILQYLFKVSVLLGGITTLMLKLSI